MGGSLIRVLVDEHRPFVRRGLCSIINDAIDMQLVGSTDSDEALLSLADKEGPEVVVMGVIQGGTERQTLTSRLKQEYPQTSILLISESITHTCANIYIDAGAAGYILTDASSDQLLQAIRTVYAGEAVIDLAFIQACARMNLSAKRGNSMAQDNLKPRELQVLQLAAKGFNNKAISQELYVSEHAVHSYFRSIFSKMHVSSRTEAIYQALLNQVIKLE